MEGVGLMRSSPGGKVMTTSRVQSAQPEIRDVFTNRTSAFVSADRGGTQRPYSDEIDGSRSKVRQVGRSSASGEAEGGLAVAPNFEPARPRAGHATSCFEMLSCSH